VNGLIKTYPTNNIRHLGRHVTAHEEASITPINQDTWAHNSNNNNNNNNNKYVSGD